jgi:phosphatidylserine/phosphatidylglycerophosphate/cardiolipin synthase-like enzyme
MFRHTVGPDIGLDGTCGSGLFSLSGIFKLADAGDQLAVVSPDGLVSDSVAYGDSDCPEVGWVGDSLPAPKAGEVVRRICGPDGVTDTDSAADWFHFREYRYGYTTNGPVSALVPAGQMTSFVSPECSLQCVVDEIHAAGESIRLCAYEFSSAGVCAALASALDRGVSVHVLVDGSPAGGMSDDEVACLSVLEARGADVFEFTTIQDGSVRHVLALHPKYMVVDSRRSMVLSENFVDSGLPVDRVFGNRGWGVAFTSSFLAYHLSALFDDDSRRDRKDVLDWGLDPRYDPRAAIPKEEAEGTFMVTQTPFTTSQDAHVAIHVSPDSSPFEPYLCGLIESSSALLAEQFQADALWESRWTGLVSGSPVVSSIGRLVGSGGEASVLLDSSWFNLDRNTVSASALCGEGADARLMTESSPITVLHNKGLVLDGERTVVSSNNWVSSSFARNRELAAVVTSAEVASYFSSTFMLDWVPDSTPPMADAGPDVRTAPGEASVLSAAGSHDDRALISYEWDVGGDGSVDGDGPVFEVDQAYPGSVTVVLTVVDSWGNHATDSVGVTLAWMARGRTSRTPSQAWQATPPSRRPSWWSPQSS